MEKNIALALASFPDAPKEVVAASDAFKTAYLRMLKANAQLKLWTAEKNTAIDIQSANLNGFLAALDKWDPAGEKAAVLLDAAVAAIPAPQTSPPVTK